MEEREIDVWTTLLFPDGTRRHVGGPIQFRVGSGEYAMRTEEIGLCHNDPPGEYELITYWGKGGTFPLDTLGSDAVRFVKSKSEPIEVFPLPERTTLEGKHSGKGRKVLASIHYNLREPTRVTIIVYDVKGRKVATLLDDHQDSGIHSVSWSGRDDSGRDVSSGEYICKVQTGDIVKTSRLRIDR
jgi:hypothetical protein